jgi:quinol monooxygenase YgiN
MISFVVHTIASEGKGDALEKEFQKLARKVKNEPGSISFAVLRENDNPSNFLVYVQYKDEESLKAHQQSEHEKAFLNATKNMLAEPSRITFYKHIT